MGIGYGSNPFVSFVQLFLPVVYILVILILAAGALSSFKRWVFNKNQPMLSVAARIRAKRTDVRGHSLRRIGENRHYMSSTYYYVLFEAEDGSTLEFQVSGEDYEIMHEGESGTLVFQGTRYIQFKGAEVEADDGAQ